MRRRLLLLLIFVPMGLLVVVAAYFLAQSPSVRVVASADGAFALRVKGRLVAFETGAPVHGAFVMTVPARSYADDAELLDDEERLNRAIQEDRPKWSGTGSSEPDPSVRARDFAADLSKEDGTFSALVLVWWWCNIVDGVATEPKPRFFRNGVRALLVKIEGAEPQIIDIDEDCGDWTEHPENREGWHKPRATWNLGTLEVKGAP